MESKYKGIDQREIKCCCENPNCCESGISFDENFLRFHFLTTEPCLHQETKAMMLNKENIDQLINALKRTKKELKNGSKQNISG
jgi:uncharacterized protein (DUF1499 family)